MTQQPSGWYSDPTKVYKYRYWNATQWTNQVSSGGTATTDANAMDPSAVTVPPAPGSAAQTPPQAAPAAPAVQVTQKSGSAFGTAIGVILAIVAIVILIVVLANNSGDGSSSTPTTGAPAPTEAPATTVAG
jgi:hypothetical protein